MAQEAKPQVEFRVAFAGIRLPAEATDRIARAIQKAVLTEIAGIDLKGGVGIRFVGNGGTQGMELIAQEAGPV
jgi:hypothetical protein